MRRVVPAVAAALLLAGPTALAFFTGGYLTEPRLVAAIVAWALLLLLALTGRAPLPRSGPGWLALGGLGLMTAWSAASIAWAPMGGPAVDNVQRLVLYVGALALSVGVLRAPAARRAVEPALAAGITVVIGYGLSGRLLPGLVHLARSRSAGGRLEQPITYWNGEGALAAVGLILCARIAGDGDRPRAVRALAAAAVVPLGAGVYLSYSRGAIAVAVLGLVVLPALAPSRAQLRASALSLTAAVLAVGAVAPFPGVASLTGNARQRDGAIALVLLAALSVAAGLVAALSREAPEHTQPRWARRLGPAVAAVAVAVGAGLVVGGLAERPSRAELAAGANASRLTAVSSNRYEYWRVALDVFREQPLRGVGSGGFRVAWLQRRTIPEVVRDTHSIEFEMAAELGLVGLLALVLAVAGTSAAAVRALRGHGAAAAGPCVAVIAWFLHASIDWDWELPAVSLPAIVLAGALIALSEEGAQPARSGSRRRWAASARRAAAGSRPRATT